MIQQDLTAVFAVLDKLPGIIGEVCQAGVDAIAPQVQLAMQSSPAHGDDSGASHASYRALTATNADAEAASGFAAAEAALAAAPAGHGSAVRQDTGITQAEGEAVMVLTDFASYGRERETAEAGKRAVEGPTLLQFGPSITQSVANESQQRFT
jgi:hypothetical protein